MRATPIGSSGQIKCSICQTVMTAGEQSIICPACGQQHHQECWDEIGGCGSYGCVEAPTLDKANAESAPQSAWGDTKQCPVCGEKIKAIAIRCRYCHTDFDTVDPLSLSDLRTQSNQELQLGRMKGIVVALFLVSLLACLAPLMAIILATYILPRRELLAKCGPIYVVLGWTAMGLSMLYSLMLLIFILTQ